MPLLKIDAMLFALCTMRYTIWRATFFMDALSTRLKKVVDHPHFITMPNHCCSNFWISPSRNICSNQRLSQLRKI